EVDEKKHGNLMLRLPHFVNGSYLYSFMHNKTISEANCTKLVGTSEYSDKILVFRPPENNTPKRSDNDIYPACEQVMPALAHYLERNMDHVKTDYYNFLQQNSLFEKFAEATNQFRKEEQGKFDEYYSKKAIETILKDINKTYLSGHLTINILVPLLIFDENTRLTKVVLDDEWKVKELVEIPSCVYLHTPSTFDRYSQVLNELYHQPILVCNYAHLSECIENITKGIKAIAEEIQKNSKDPKRVAETVLKGFYLRQEPIMSWPSH
ncbi:MAG: hypothetical protein JW834_04870, partial [Candidatus Diapherotrites archaeon]|nr:hypothetical protein [Candidatus Diapherotrites archaeon]